ncbi:MAG: DUF1828 domain-containing protein [Candidatus Pacebacteria bacterium]|nr:DUF1828 domain-containing protein [Candidatus Paceibacterota bacterium]
MSWIDEVLNDYYKFLKQKTVVQEIGTSEWVEISTPFMDVFNDTIDIYAKKSNGKIILSDDGKTIQNLKLSGVEIFRSQHRKALLERIFLTYGVRLENNELIVEATEATFPQKKLNLLAAISETNDLYIVARHIVASVFREDVQKFLDEQELIYTPYFISKGSTGLEFTFDFQIAFKHAELLIKAFNSVNKLNLPHFLFTWDDVKQVRERQTAKQVVGLAVINDEEKEVKGEYLEALQSRGAKYILWKERNKPENIRLLKAA